MSRNTQFILSILPFMLIALGFLVWIALLMFGVWLPPGNWPQTIARTIPLWMERYPGEVGMIAVLAFLPLLWALKLTIENHGDMMHEDEKNRRDHALMERFAPDYHIPPRRFELPKWLRDLLQRG